LSERRAAAYILGMSPVADAKVLRTAVKERGFAPAYYFYGDDDYLKGEELRRLIDAAIDPATRDFNLEFLRGAEVDATTLGSIAGTPPMMAERRAVVVRDVNALKKDARAVLDAYLERPAPDALILLVSGAGVKPDKALLSAATAVEFAPLSGARIPRWISYYVEHDVGGGATITSGAVRLLQEAVGTELAQLRVELDKLVAFTGGGIIDEAAVSAVVGIRPGETLGDFLDAVARRDAVAAIGMLDNVMQQPKASAVTTVMALTSQTLVIAWSQSARERGSHAGKLTQDLFSLLKESGSVFTGRSWGEFVATCVRESERWSPAAIDSALDALLDADKTLKDSRVSSDEQVLATLVLLLCGARSGRRAA
jgi:DNA polymerase-3 subunit delta